MITYDVGFGATKFSIHVQGSYHAPNGIARNNLGVVNSINIAEILRWRFEHG